MKSGAGQPVETSPYEGSRELVYLPGAGGFRSTTQFDNLWPKLNLEPYLDLSTPATVRCLTRGLAQRFSATVRCLTRGLAQESWLAGRGRTSLTLNLSGFSPSSEISHLFGVK